MLDILKRAGLIYGLLAALSVVTTLKMLGLIFASSFSLFHPSLILYYLLFVLAGAIASIFNLRSNYDFVATATGPIVVGIFATNPDLESVKGYLLTVIGLSAAYSLLYFSAYYITNIIKLKTV